MPCASVSAKRTLTSVAKLNPCTKPPCSQNSSAPISRPSCSRAPASRPSAAIDRAKTLAQGARLLLVVGSSLEVWPVAGLPEEALAHGGKLAIVNRDATPYDDRAELVIRGTAGEILAGCVTSMSSS